jgi:hypothetical protein
MTSIIQQISQLAYIEEDECSPLAALERGHTTPTRGGPMTPDPLPTSDAAKLDEDCA